MTDADPDRMVRELRVALEAIADPDKVEPMTAYMKGRATFLGVQAGDRRGAQRSFIAAGQHLDEHAVLSLAETCWRQPEREFRYAATDLLRKWAATLTPASLDRLEALIRADPWWDTVDALAAWTVGPLVRANPELAAVMDEWIGGAAEPAGGDMWIARTSILHQLGFKGATDGDRLFKNAVIRGQDREFFIRKALGWSLRQYARTDADAVRRFLRDHDAQLSGLTKREAAKHL